MREKFFTLYDQLCEKRDRAWDREGYQEKFEERLYAAYFEKFPRRRKRYPVEKVAGMIPEIYAEHLERLEQRIEAGFAEWTAFKEGSREELSRLAEGVDIPPADEPVVYKTIYVHVLHTGQREGVRQSGCGPG